MAIIEPRVFHPKPATINNNERPVFDYDAVSDTLMIGLSALAFVRPGVSVPVSDFEYFRVDAESEEVLGMQVEDFLFHAVYVNPIYLGFTETIGLDADTLASVKQAVADRQARMTNEERERTLVEAMMLSWKLGKGVA